MSPNSDKCVFHPAGDLILLLQPNENERKHEDLPVELYNVSVDDPPIEYLSDGDASLRSSSDRVSVVDAAVDDAAVDDAAVDDAAVDDAAVDDAAVDDAAVDDAVVDDATAADNSAADDAIGDTADASDLPDSAQLAGPAPMVEEMSTGEELAKHSEQIVHKMQVSSMHLSLHSSVFNDMLVFKNVDNASEGTKSNLETTEIELQGDDFYALEILLNIIHCHNERVPRVVNALVLWNVVMLIEKYEFDETTKIFTDMWFKHLKSTLPNGVRDDLIFWIYVCHKLGQSEEFTNMTRIAILKTDCDFQYAQKAQVPYWVIGEYILFICIRH